MDINLTEYEQGIIDGIRLLHSELALTGSHIGVEKAANALTVRMMQKANARALMEVFTNRVPESKTPGGIPEGFTELENSTYFLEPFQHIPVNKNTEYEVYRRSLRIDGKKIPDKDDVIDFIEYTRKHFDEFNIPDVTGTYTGKIAEISNKIYYHLEQDRSQEHEHDEEGNCIVPEYLIMTLPMNLTEEFKKQLQQRNQVS